MSHPVNNDLFDRQRQEIEVWMYSKGCLPGDLKKDEKGYFVMFGDIFCSCKDPRCDKEEFCGCKSKLYLPDNLQDII